MAAFILTMIVNGNRTGQVTNMLIFCCCIFVRELLIIYWLYALSFQTPSVLWHCWLGGRKGIRPVKNWVVGCWGGCQGWGADLHIAQQISLPLTVSCSSISRLVYLSWFYLSGSCSPG